MCVLPIAPAPMTPTDILLTSSSPLGFALRDHEGIVLDIPSMRSGMHDRRHSSDFLTRQQSKQVEKVRSDVDRGSATGKRGIKCPACACGLVPVRRTDDESERHVVEVRRNVSLGILERGQQVAYRKDERYRAIDAC